MKKFTLRIELTIFVMFLFASAPCVMAQGSKTSIFNTDGKLAMPTAAAKGSNPEYAKLREENVLAIHMTDEQIAFYYDPSQWPKDIPAAKREEYIHEKSLNLRIVHIDAYRPDKANLMQPSGPYKNAWYQSPTVNLNDYVFNRGNVNTQRPVNIIANPFQPVNVIIINSPFQSIKK